MRRILSDASTLLRLYRPTLSAEMVDLLHKLKPAAPARIHLLLAALLWSVVGCLLAYFGTKWVFQSDGEIVHWLLIPMIILGLIKARFILFKAADRTIRRIRSRGDGRCVGGFLSWKTWLLVLFMMAFGRTLRSDLVPIPLPWVGLIYAGVGVALAVASIRLWVSLHHLPRSNDGADAEG